MTNEVITKLKEWCVRHHYGPWDFKKEAQRQLTAHFAFMPATEAQLKATEKILGFPLPSFLRSLYQEIANGGFGPGAGLRGAVGGYGSIGTTTITGYPARSDETVVKYHARGSAQNLLGQAQVSDHWQRSPDGNQVLYIQYNTWIREMLPLFDMGDQVEMCTSPGGQLFLHGTTEWEDIFAFTAMNITLEEWLLEQLAVSI
jgi:hypothetical protein